MQLIGFIKCVNVFNKYRGKLMFEFNLVLYDFGRIKLQPPYHSIICSITYRYICFANSLSLHVELDS